ncbi:hypothetical protein DSO57_1036662 [Entomophthora muscae]|uniref:Uncharacterized protein n=1 Tax=Entomophthora muscae TaxID=34485 RepID=A0ACC2TKY9_9FUNG|nr:hypothetical protein DSO57_1036662 [Entomophthora muscae]
MGLVAVPIVGTFKNTKLNLITPTCGSNYSKFNPPTAAKKPQLVVGKRFQVYMAVGRSGPPFETSCIGASGQIRFSQPTVVCTPTPSKR